jgi:hypothetical protein
MSLLEAIIIGVIVLSALVYIVFQVIKPFKSKNDPCQTCPFAANCGKETKCE